ncbi:hypothetical protein C8F01DRAFT_1142328, partial [Mycena amicta]
DARIVSSLLVTRCGYTNSYTVQFTNPRLCIRPVLQQNHQQRCSVCPQSTTAHRSAPHRCSASWTRKHHHCKVYDHRRQWGSRCWLRCMTWRREVHVRKEGCHLSCWDDLSTVPDAHHMSGCSGRYRRSRRRSRCRSRCRSRRRIDVQDHQCRRDVCRCDRQR